MFTKSLTRMGLGIVLVSGIALAGCSTAPANPPAAGTKPSTGATAPTTPTPSQTSDAQAKLEDFLPTSVAYKELTGSTLKWQVTRTSDQVKVTETRGDAKLGVVYTLQVKDGALIQTKIGNTDSVQMDRQRTWLALPAKSFTSEYQTEDARVKEEASEEWTNSEEFGKLLHVHIVRTFTQGGTFTVDEYYKAGVGLFSRQVKDKDGTVVDKLDLAK